MKRITSVSIGSSKRNKRTEQWILGEKVILERIGTDGSIKKAIEIIQDLDGKVDAFGMGGIDLYVACGRKRYTLRDGKTIAKVAKKTPIVDGSRLKDTLERRVIQYLAKNRKVEFKGKTVLLVCGMDRFGMAEALQQTGCDLILGDLVFVLNLPIPLRSLNALDKVARIIGPIVVNLPFSMLYPTGEKQDNTDREKTLQTKYYHQADIIAGDFHYMKRYMPDNMSGKVIITNTVTEHDIEWLKRLGVDTLITTTPEMDGRSFGTNVMEGLIVAMLDKTPDQISDQEINDLLDQLNFRPRVEVLNPIRTSLS